MATSTQLKHMLTLESEPGPFISFFVPNSEVNHAKFYQLITNAKRQLKSGYPKQSWQPYGNKLKHLRFPHFIHHQASKSFAIYIGPTILRVFRLNYFVKTKSIVNDTMWILPLIMETQFKHLHNSHLLYKNAIKNLRVHYRFALRNHQAGSNLSNIVRIAPAGLIDTLLINHEAPSDVQRTLNDLAITTIGFGGRVFVLSKRAMPNRINAAIIRRK